MLWCLPFKRMLVLTRPWALQTWFGSVVFQRCSRLPRTVLRLVSGRARSYRREVLHEMHMHKIYLSNLNKISLLKLSDKHGVYGWPHSPR
jgi:hypothetical protein